MVPHQIDGGPVLSQLQCSGMTSVLELMQQGYPSRTQFKELYNMYKGFMPPDLARLDPRLFCKCLFKALGLDDTDFKFGLTKIFFRPGKFAEFDAMLRADPAHLAELVKKVKKWLLRIRWKKAQWCALMVIKLKNKILWRREQLVKIQSHVRGWLAQRRYRPKYMAILKVKSLQSQIDSMTQTLKSLKNQGDGQRSLQGIESALKSLIVDIRDKPVRPNEVERRYQELLAHSESTLTTLRKQAHTERSEEERLRKLEIEMQAEKERRAEDERKAREAEDAKTKRMEIERQRKEEEAEFAKKELAQKTLIDEQQKLWEAAEKEKEQKAEQERRDRELAQRLAHESNGTVEDTPPSGGEGGGSSGSVNSKYDLSKWKYADLRDVINTSSDIDLLQACKNEFHRRLAAYQKWQDKNKKQANPQRAPDYVLNNANSQMAGPSNGQQPQQSRPQRFFRVPFSRPTDRYRDGANGQQLNGERKMGMWYAHFDGPWIARQMEFHPNKRPTLLLKGRDDMEMCELCLEKTGLTRKRGAEILVSEFEAEWRKHGGPAYTLPASNQPPKKNMFS